MTKLVVYNDYKWNEMKWIETTKSIVYIMNMKIPKKDKWLLQMIIFLVKLSLNFAYIQLLVANLQYLVTRLKFSHTSLLINWF